MRQLWKKTEAKKAIESIAQEVAKAFGIAVPHCFIPDFRIGQDWQYEFETVQVWTKAGAADMNISISNSFAHMYFRFDDPKRAIPFDDHMSRLNRHSGKWNSLESAPYSLTAWIEELKSDFAKVAELNPPQSETTAYKAKKDAQAAQWAAYRAEFETKES